jgi:hypothetical protein
MRRINFPTAVVAGRRYQIRSTTVATRRAGTKMNNIGLLDEVEWNGQELAFFITDGTKRYGSYFAADRRAA